MDRRVRVLTRPGQSDIQATLFPDYRTNVASYPSWQKWLRERRYDPSFAVAGATAYADDVPGAEVHLLEAGHFALDEATDEIASHPLDPAVWRSPSPPNLRLSGADI